MAGMNVIKDSLEVEVKVCEISLQEDDENEVYSPDPYEVSLDANSILSNINAKNVETFLQTLARIYGPLSVSHETEIIKMALATFSDGNRSDVVKTFLETICELVKDCFQDTKGQKITQNKAIDLEKKFAEKRSSGPIYCAIKKSWECVLSTRITGNTEAGVHQASVEILQQVLQHCWSSSSSSSHGKIEVDKVPIAYSQFNYEGKNDYESIRDHAGWAIKRARDVIMKGHNLIPAKENVDEKSAVVHADKTTALSLISQLGEDVKQPDGSYRFLAYEHVVPFFTFLHMLVENIMNPTNLISQRGNILMECLDQLSKNKELRKKWMNLTPTNSDIKASVVVLQRIVTFFVKSKQQIIREKEGLKPNKNSMAIRQELKQVKRSKPEAKTSLPQTQRASKNINEQIIQLRSNFKCPNTVTEFLTKLKTLTLSEQESILAILQGKELAKMLKALGQPTFIGKKKSKQITILVQAVKAGITVKFPDEVSMINKCMKTCLLCKYTYMNL